MSRVMVPQPMTETMARALRLNALRDVLDDARWWSAAELAERFGMTVRTMQRDLGALETMGYGLEVKRSEEARSGNAPRYRLMRRQRSDAA